MLLYIFTPNMPSSPFLPRCGGKSPGVICSISPFTSRAPVSLVAFLSRHILSLVLQDHTFGPGLPLLPRFLPLPSWMWHFIITFVLFFFVRTKHRLRQCSCCCLYLLSSLPDTCIAHFLTELKCSLFRQNFPNCAFKNRLFPYLIFAISFLCLTFSKVSVTPSRMYYLLFLFPTRMLSL